MPQHNTAPDIHPCPPLRLDAPTLHHKRTDRGQAPAEALLDRPQRITLHARPLTRRQELCRVYSAHEQRTANVGDECTEGEAASEGALGVEVCEVEAQHRSGRGEEDGEGRFVPPGRGAEEVDKEGDEVAEDSGEEQEIVEYELGTGSEAVVGVGSSGRCGRGRSARGGRWQFFGCSGTSGPSKMSVDIRYRW